MRRYNVLLYVILLSFALVSCGIRQVHSGKERKVEFYIPGCG
jgi:hypothetical protein